VLNIMANSAFDSVGNFAERKAYAESLGAASATDFGFVGPEYIRFLLSHENTARAAIAKNLAVWKAVSALLLGAAPSPQASRVASRVGSFVAPAALAAEVLNLPWGADLTKFGVSAREIFQLLRAYYHSAPGGAFIPCGAKAADIIADDEPLAPQVQTVPIRGLEGANECSDDGRCLRPSEA
jgi:hypothetical protein